MSVKHAVSICTVLILLFSFTAGVYAKNLIRNGGMEEGEGNPANWGMWGWQMKNAKFKLENGAAHTGSRFATIINNENNDARFIQEVLVEEGKLYKISGWIKTNNVGTNEDVKGASISLLEGSEFSSMDIKGTNGMWEPVEFYLLVGSHIMKVTVSLGVGGFGKVNTGQASFDDVVMEEVNSSPEGVTIFKIEGEPKIIPTPPKTNVAVLKRQNASAPPENKEKSNVMFIIIIILVVVIAATVVVLLLLPKSKKIESNEETKEASEEKDT